jgi:hypothetical protein
MRRSGLILLLLAGAALAVPTDALMRSLQRAERDLAKAARTVREVGKEKSASKRLKKLQRTEKQYGSVLRKAAAGVKRSKDALRASFLKLVESAKRELVAVLNDQTRLLWERGSVSKARKVNRRALELAPKNKDALALKTTLTATKGGVGAGGYQPGYVERRAGRNARAGMDHRNRQHARR